MPAGLDSESQSRSRDLERVAMSYIDGLLAADGSRVCFTDRVRRAHLMIIPGSPFVWQTAEGADLIRADFAREALIECKNLRLTVDIERSSVVAIWESAMDHETAKAITIVERFTIVDGLIDEVEIISIPQATEFAKVPYPGWEAVMANVGKTK